MKSLANYLFLLGFLAIIGHAKAQKPVQIEFRIKGLENQSSLLVNYFANKQYIKDSLHFDEKGKALYTSTDTLHTGIYIVYMPNQKIFEFIGSGKENMKVYSSLDNPVKDLEIKGSKENDVFVPYQKKLDEIGDKILPLRKKLDEAVENGDKDQEKVLREEITAINKQLNDYRISVAENNKELFLSKVIMAMQDVNIPESVDTTNQYRYFKDHYFDNIDLSEAGLLYTPIYYNKLEFYFDKLVHPHYDSVIQDVSALLNKLDKSNKELYRYTLSRLLSKFESSKLITHENVFYFIGDEYYFNRTPPEGTSEEFLKKLRERLDKIKTCRIGQQAMDFIAKDKDGNFRSLSQMNYDFTILIIYDPHCGTCKKTMKQLSEYFEAHKNKHNVGIYSASTNERKDDDKITVPNDPRWVDVFDSNGYRSLYDSYSVPLIYILDKNKKILMKRVSVEQVEDIIERESEFANK